MSGEFLRAEELDHALKQEPLSQVCCRERAAALAEAFVWIGDNATLAIAGYLYGNGSTSITETFLPSRIITSVEHPQIGM